MYAWERPFSAAVGALRKAEQRVLSKAGFMVSIFNSIVPIASVCAAALTFATTAAVGGNLKAYYVYATLALFEMMRYTLATAPMSVRVRALG